MRDPEKKLAKLNVATSILNKGSLLIHFDPRVKEVIVPPWLTAQAHLVLQVGWDMMIPIPDLRVDNHGVYGTLSFSRSPYICDVPWSAVFALVGEEGQGMVWEENIPAEILADEASLKVKPVLATGKSSEKKTPRGKTKLPSYLRVVK